MSIEDYLHHVGVRATRNLFPARALWLANGGDATRLY
jgi:hypothetical protein